MTFIEAARSYIGVPWKHLGRSRRGLDCAGLPLVAFRDCGIELPAPKRYGRNPFQDGLMRALVDAADQPVWTGLKGTCRHAFFQVGDVVVMAPASQPRHIAIVADDPMYEYSIIHADGSPGVGRVVEHGLSDYYLKMIVAVFRRSV